MNHGTDNDTPVTVLQRCANTQESAVLSVTAIDMSAFLFSLVRLFPTSITVVALRPVRSTIPRNESPLSCILIMRLHSNSVALCDVFQAYQSLFEFLSQTDADIKFQRIYTDLYMHVPREIFEVSTQTTYARFLCISKYFHIISYFALPVKILIICEILSRYCNFYNQ